MTAEKATQRVRKFYDEIGWKKSGQLEFQNAQFEDLRPVSSQYIHLCHLRVNRFLNQSGQYFLDIGSGPVQYPEYLTYSAGYQFRVCLDISLRALEQAREKLKGHGLYVLADAAHLPFTSNIFEGAVSLHTFHHLDMDNHLEAYREVNRLLKKGGCAVAVNGWKASPLMKRFDHLMALAERFLQKKDLPHQDKSIVKSANSVQKPARTFVEEFNAPLLKSWLAGQVPLQVRVWRSVNVRFLRALIHPWLGGRYWLKLIYWLEERFPYYLGENGAYPMVIVEKK
jgi:SAM-dependent methyltransferase